MAAGRKLTPYPRNLGYMSVDPYAHNDVQVTYKMTNLEINIGVLGKSKKESKKTKSKLIMYKSPRAPRVTTASGQ